MVFFAGDTKPRPPSSAVPEFQPVTLLDRPNLFISNLLRLDPQAAALALFAPDRLSPEERQTVSQRIMGAGRKNVVLKTLLDISTHPMVLLGLLAAVKFPVMRAGDLLKIAPKFSAYKRVLHPLVAKISSSYVIFEGTPVARIMDKIVVARARFLEKWLDKFGEAISTAAKRKGSIVSSVESYLVSGKVEALDSRASWLSKRAGLKGALLNRKVLDRALRERKLDALASGVRKTLDEFVKEYRKLSPDLRDRVAKAMERRHKVGFPGTKLKEPFWPHVLSEDAEGLRETLLRSMELATDMGEKMRLKKLVENVDRVASVHWVTRRGKLAMVPSPRELDLLEKEFPGIVNKEVRERLFGRLKARAEWGRSALRRLVDFYAEQPEGADRETIKRVMIDLLAGRKSGLRRVIKGQSREAIKAYNEKLKKNPLYFFQEGPLKGTSKWEGFRYPRAIARQIVNAAEEELLAGDKAKAAEILENSISDAANTLPYTLDMTRALEHYINSMGHEWAFTVETTTGRLGRKVGLGEALTEWRKEFLNRARKAEPESPEQIAALQRAEMLEKDYVPLLRGELPTDAKWAGMFWKTLKYRAHKWLTGDGGKKLVPEIVRKPLIQKLQKSIVHPAGTMGADVAGYLYLSTLGFNPSPALKNIFQTAITTGPLLGLDSMTQGINRLFPKARKYIQLRARGISDVDAMKQAFPDFMEAGMPLDPITRLATPKHLERYGLLEKFKRAGMFTFAQTERFNRLLTWEAAMAHAEKGGIKAGSEAAKAFARDLVGATQFTAGVAGTPYGLLRVSPVFRQFAHFPVRFTEFLRRSTVMGSGAEGPGFGRRQWGTIGRVAAVSAGIYVAARNLTGVDMSGALLSGALPLPTFPESPFYPLPFVPPVLSIAGTGIKAMATGETRGLGATAALLVPGGLAARRVYRTFHPRFADYSMRTPDGRIPVYSDKGMLIGYRSPRELVLRGMGFRTADAETERELTQYLLKQRDQIREYRRAYVEAMAKNDTEKMQEIQEEFKRRYPQLGPIQLKRSDITALENRKLHVRVSRILKGFPKEYRSTFQQIAAVSLGPSVFGPEGFSPSAGQYYMQF